MFLVNPNDLSNPSVRRGLLIDVEYALDEEMNQTAAKTWQLIQEFDAKDLDFVREKNYKRIRGMRTVRHILLS